MVFLSRVLTMILVLKYICEVYGYVYCYAQLKRIVMYEYKGSSDQRHMRKPCYCVLSNNTVTLSISPYFQYINISRRI